MSFLQSILLAQTEEFYAIDTNLRVSVFCDLVLENNTIIMFINIKSDLIIFDRQIQIDEHLTMSLIKY